MRQRAANICTRQGKAGIVVLELVCVALLREARLDLVIESLDMTQTNPVDTGVLVDCGGGSIARGEIRGALGLKVVLVEMNR